MPSLFPAPPASSSAASEWISAHCDGGARGNPGPAGYGAIVQDAGGRTLAELSVFLGNKTNNFAEYSGLLGVLEWTLAQGYTHLRVVSDSELMVKQIQGKYKVNSPDLRPLWQEARNRIAKLERFEISHALRHKNKTADRLANEAMDRGMGKAPAAKAAAVAAPDASPAAPRQAARAEVPAVAAAAGQPIRGFVRDNTVHLLDGATLPDNVFVRIVRE